MDQPNDLPIIPASRTDDLHGLAFLPSSQLNLFMAGNQFMVMEELMAAFQQAHPHIQRIYYQTLPPGLQLKQILAGGATWGGQVIDAQADIYATVSKQAVVQLIRSGHVAQDDYWCYLRNRLVLLVPSGNPANIEQVTDLGEDPVRISQPDPANEDIAYPIIDMYREAGGSSLVQRIMEEKRAEGTTIMTLVHHRETPLRLLKKTVDVGPVWATEAVHARKRGLPVEVIDPGPALDQRSRVKYYLCRLRRAPHPNHADAFLRFMASGLAQSIYRRYGFVTERHEARDAPLSPAKIP